MNSNQRNTYAEFDERLRASELSYRRLFEAARDGILILDVDTGRITDVNPFLVELLGFSHGEMMGKTVGELSPFKDIEENKVMLERLQRDEYVRYEDLPLETRDGRHIAVEFVSNVYQAGDKNVIQCNVREITERKQAEAALRASEDRFRTLFEYAPDGIVIADKKSTYLDANLSICRMLGYTRNELIGLNASDIVAQTEIPHIGPALTAIQAESDYHREWQFRRKDGSTFQAEVIATQMPDGNLLGMIRDITERMRTEGRIRRLVDSNLQGVIFWNTKGDITMANDAFLRMLGYSREDMGAGGIGWAKMTPPEYADSDRRSLEEIAAHGFNTPYEKEFMRKDGSRVPVLVGAAIFDDEPDEGVCFVLDITERKRTEQALRESEGRFRFLNELTEATRTLADPAQIMAVMARMLGGHLHTSRCAYADVEKDGEQFTILHDYTDGCASTVGHYQLSLFGALAVATLRSGQTFIIRNVEAELMPAQGADMFNAIGIQAIITCPLVKEGSLRALMAVHQTAPRDWKPGEIAIVQDVVERCWATIERRTAEEKIHQLNTELEQRVVERTAQLEASNQELEAFSYSVSHDLRAPLRHVMGYVELLKKEAVAALSATSLRHLDTISQSAKRMGDLIDDLLAFSRIGKSGMTRENVDLNRLIQETLGDLQAETKDRNIVWEIHPLPEVKADRPLPRLALINLISNALKFTGNRAQARVEIGSVPGGDNETVIFIRDNGAGFDPHYTAKLFGVFQRLHSQAEFPGTGIGLANVQRIIQRHGGRVWAEGAINNGATFSFSIPKPDGRADAAPISPVDVLESGGQ